MKKAVLVLVMLLVTIVTTIAEVKTDYVNLNGTKYMVVDMSDDLPEGYDILREELAMVINNADRYEIVSVEPILSWNQSISKAIDSRISVGDDYNSEGKKFYNGQLMYAMKSGNVVHYILAGYGIFGGVRTTTMYHIAYQEVK